MTTSDQEKLRIFINQMARELGTDPIGLLLMITNTYSEEEISKKFLKGIKIKKKYN